MDPIDEKVMDSLVKSIAEDIREALVRTPGTSLEQVRNQIMGSMTGVSSVELDPEDPTQVIISWTPPKQVVFTCVLDLPEIEH